MDATLRSMSIDSALAVLNALSWTAPTRPSTLIKFSGKSPATVRRVLHNLQILGIVSDGDEGQQALTCSVPREDDGEQRRLLRAAVQDIPFFQRACQFLDLGESTEASLRKAAALADSQEMTFNEPGRLLSWAEELGIISKSGPAQYRVAGDIEVAKRNLVAPSVLPRDLDSEMAANLFISEQLGVEAFSFLDRQERLRLVDAFLNHADDPEQSCEDSGKTLENFLRLVANLRGVAVQDCTGITQLADRLAGKNCLAIHPHHRSLCAAVAALRAASAHDRDKLTNHPWTKTAEVALACALLTLRIIRSVHAWACASRTQTL
jgi:hypothetical protein